MCPIEFATGTTTNLMLDGVPCDTIIEGILLAGQAGCENAESVGHGIAPGIGYVQFNSIGSSGAKFWHNGTNVLKYNSWEFGNPINSVNSDIIGHVTPETTNKTIYYTESLKYSRIDSEFGITGHTILSGEKSYHGCHYINIHMNNTNVCAIRGMRLPIPPEIKSSDTGNTSCLTDTPSSNGIGFNSGNSWSATAYGGMGFENYVRFTEYTIRGNISYTTLNNIICVR